MGFSDSLVLPRYSVSSLSSVLFSFGVAADDALGDPVPLELVPGSASPSGEGPLLAGAGPANAYDIIPIARATIEEAIGNFMRGEQLQRHNVKINGFYPPWLR